MARVKNKVINVKVVLESQGNRDTREHQTNHILDN
jgi:hypothetical protein